MPCKIASTDFDLVVPRRLGSVKLYIAEARPLKEHMKFGAEHPSIPKLHIDSPESSSSGRIGQAEASQTSRCHALALFSGYGDDADPSYEVRRLFRRRIQVFDFIFSKHFKACCFLFFFILSVMMT